MTLKKIGSGLALAAARAFEGRGDFFFMSVLG